MTFDFDADDLFSTPSKVSPEPKKHNSPLLRGSRGSGSKPEPRQPSPRPVETERAPQAQPKPQSPGPGEGKSRLVELARKNDLEEFYKEASQTATDWVALHDEALQNADSILKDAYALVQGAATPEAKKEAQANLRNAQDGYRDLKLWAP